MHLQWGGQDPLDGEQSWALTRYRLAQTFHWNFDYIDNQLTEYDLLTINAIAKADELRKPKKPDINP